MSEAIKTNTSEYARVVNEHAAVERGTVSVQDHEEFEVSANERYDMESYIAESSRIGARHFTSTAYSREGNFQGHTTTGIHAATSVSIVTDHSNPLPGGAYTLDIVVTNDKGDRHTVTVFSDEPIVPAVTVVPADEV